MSSYPAYGDVRQYMSAYACFERQGQEREAYRKSIKLRRSNLEPLLKLILGFAPALACLGSGHKGVSWARDKRRIEFGLTPVSNSSAEINFRSLLDRYPVYRSSTAAEDLPSLSS